MQKWSKKHVKSRGWGPCLIVKIHQKWIQSLTFSIKIISFVSQLCKLSVSFHYFLNLTIHLSHQIFIFILEQFNLFFLMIKVSTRLEHHKYLWKIKFMKNSPVNGVSAWICCSLCSHRYVKWVISEHFRFSSSFNLSIIFSNFADFNLLFSLSLVNSASAVTNRFSVWLKYSKLRSGWRLNGVNGRKLTFDHHEVNSDVRSLVSFQKQSSHVPTSCSLNPKKLGRIEFEVELAQFVNHQQRHYYHSYS